MKLSKVYDPKRVEEKIYQFWEKGGFFKPEIKKGEKPFVIVLPPPNITGSLHMGHALNSVIQDILIRKARMEGLPTLWVPGTDHAGIATQVVVEKELKKEGKTRFDLGKEKFIKRCWEWKEKYGQIIIKQLKKLGLSCDWSRKRFTLDKGYSEAVLTAFFHYKNKGYLYQGERVINWCPRCQTALSDIELEHKEIKGKLWFIRYPLKLKSKNEKVKMKIKNSKFIIVATTRPETMLGDTGVAVNPEDKRYKNLVGQKVILPLINREIPIVSDRVVDPEFGTGAVKVTPAHDPDDFEIAERNKLPKIKVIDERGRITQEGGKYAGLERFEAREKILKDLKAKNLLMKTEDYTYSLPHCDRCKTVIEQLPSQQWFIKMDQLKKLAIEAIEKEKIKFIPSQWKRVLLSWLKNLKDWCISRQIWWGHRLPVFIKQEKIRNSKFEIRNKSQIQNSQSLEIYVGDNPPNGYKQVDDLLDTWFSSALWPFAVFGWPKKTKDLEYFYPTTILTTAREILFLWVARMIFSGLEFMGKIPFETVYIHPVVLAETGQKMAKSLGTGVNPLDLIKKYGADGTRFGLAWQLTGLQDLRFKVETMVAARNFCNKIWNAARFILQNSAKNIRLPNKEEISKKTKADQEILKNLEQTTKEVNKNLNNFRFGQAAQALYHFFWHRFCDRYIEESKIQMENDKLRENTQKILLYVLENSLKLLHPFIPFITEEIWQKLKEKEPLIISKWPRT